MVNANSTSSPRFTLLVAHNDGSADVGTSVLRIRLPPVTTWIFEACCQNTIRYDSAEYYIRVNKYNKQPSWHDDYIRIWPAHHMAQLLFAIWHRMSAQADSLLFSQRSVLSFGPVKHAVSVKCIAEGCCQTTLRHGIAEFCIKVDMYLLRNY